MKQHCQLAGDGDDGTIAGLLASARGGASAAVNTVSNTVQALHCGVRTKNCVIVSDPDHLVVTLGVEGLVVVQSGNATLVTTRKGEAEVKDLIEKIKAQGLGRFL